MDESFDNAIDTSMYLSAIAGEKLKKKELKNKSETQHKPVVIYNFRYISYLVHGQTLYIGYIDTAAITIISSQT